MQFRAEFFNIFNHTQFNGLVGGSGNIVASNFGFITNGNAPRIGKSRPSSCSEVFWSAAGAHREGLPWGPKRTTIA